MNFSKHLVTAIVFVSIAGTAFISTASGQSVPAAGTDAWTWVGSDDGQFAVQIPASHRYFTNPDGFIVSGTRDEHALKKMHMVNAVSNGTMLSFEVYEASKGALDALYDRNQNYRGWEELPKITRDSVTIRQLKKETDQHYSRVQYFAVKKNIYVVFAASRKGETPEMEKFFDHRLGKQAAGVSPKPYSKLDFVDVKVEMNEDAEQQAKPAAPVKPQPDDPSLKPMAAVLSPTPSYVGPARRKNISGTVKFRLTLAEDGSIPHIEVLKSLPEGLLRQALFAAMRMKFLPEERDGKPVTSRKLVEFNFQIR